MGYCRNCIYFEQKESTDGLYHSDQFITLRDYNLNKLLDES